MFDLNGKVAIVTGANQGLGFAMCQGLAKAGADIFNIGRREDDHVIREAIEKEGVKYHYYRADLSNPTVEKMDEIVEEVITYDEIFERRYKLLCYFANKNLQPVEEVSIWDKIFENFV